MYKVFEIKGGTKEGKDGYEVFWCPSAPVHYNDRVPYNGRIYPQKQGAYRKCKQLNDETKPHKAVERKEPS